MQRTDSCAWGAQLAELWGLHAQTSQHLGLTCKPLGRYLRSSLQKKATVCRASHKWGPTCTNATYWQLALRWLCKASSAPCAAQRQTSHGLGGVGHASTAVTALQLLRMRLLRWLWPLSEGRALEVCILLPRL